MVQHDHWQPLDSNNYSKPFHICFDHPTRYCFFSVQCIAITRPYGYILAMLHEYNYSIENGLKLNILCKYICQKCGCIHQVNNIFCITTFTSYDLKQLQLMKKQHVYEVIETSKSKHENMKLHIK